MRKPISSNDKLTRFHRETCFFRAAFSTISRCLRFVVGRDQQFLRCKSESARVSRSSYTGKNTGGWPTPMSDRIHFSWSGCQVLFHHGLDRSHETARSLQNQRENIPAFACASLIETLNLYRDAI